MRRPRLSFAPRSYTYIVIAATVNLITLSSCPCDARSNGNLTAIDQRDILLLFFAFTGGENHWINKTGWNSNSNSNHDFQEPCSWYGIQCEDDKIISMDLTENNLVGVVPWEIFLLPDLKSIQLPSNQIQDIDMNVAADSDSIPNSQNLRIEIDHDQKITQEKLQGMRADMAEINKLKLPSDTIIDLNLAGNNIIRVDDSFSLPISLLDLLPNLQRLDLSMNKLTGTVPDFRHYKSLHTINLTSSGLTGTLPSFLLNSSRSLYSHNQRFTVDFSVNDLIGDIPVEFVEFSQLDLFLRDNRIQRIPDTLCLQSEWMDGTVGQFGCNAILCPPQYFSTHGRQIQDELPCMICNRSNSSNFFGQSVCGETKDKKTIEVPIEEKEEIEKVWGTIRTRRFWYYFSVFVVALAGFLTCMDE